MSPHFQVWGVYPTTDHPPLALGMVMSYAQQHLGGDARISFMRRIINNEDQLRAAIAEANSADCTPILLFSDYLWTLKENLRLSRLAKALERTCVTIHGGPDAPIYSDAAERFLTREESVDFIVANEGEETLTELLATIVSGNGRRNDVVGIRYLDNGVLINTGQRARIKNVDALPSPYLSGFFDDTPISGAGAIIIETFRGCPYSCAFCDWGSLAVAKVSTFSLDRVLREIDWAASRRAERIWIADSNFGILERDVEIIRHITELRAATGYPKFLTLTFAKNIKKRVIDIVEMMVKAGIIGRGIISLQTADEDTLRAIRRSNIKTAEYEKLRHAFAVRNLPLTVELMLALPGSTVESFKNDLRYHFDLPVTLCVHRTVVLTNSPMADPDYMRAHGVCMDETQKVVALATMDRADIDLASAICRAFQGVHQYGVLRHLIQLLHWEEGIDPLDLIHTLLIDDIAEDDLPLLRRFAADSWRASPEISDLNYTLFEFREMIWDRDAWAVFGAEFLTWANRRYGVTATNGIQDLAGVQAALMPARGAAYPRTIRSAHDVLSWYRDWSNGEGRPLADYGPGELTVEDPFDFSNRPCTLRTPGLPADQWELASALVDIRRERAKTMPTPKGGARDPDRGLRSSAIAAPAPAP